MAAASIRTAGLFLVLVPTVAYGGVSLLGFISRRTPGYLDNPVRQNLFRAGHAHAGVLIILALVGLLYVDQADIGDGLKLVPGRRPDPDAARVLPLGGLTPSGAAQPHDPVHLCGRPAPGRRDPHPGHRAPARLSPHTRRRCRRPRSRWGRDPSPCGFGSRPCDRSVV